MGEARPDKLRPMSQNPFEAPRTAAPYAAPAGPTYAEGTGTFDLGVAMSEAWERTTQNAAPLILGTIVGGLVMVLGYVTIVGILLIVPVVGYGMVRLLLDAYDGEAEVGAVFAGFQRYGQALGAMLMLFLVFFATALPTYVLSGLGIYLESMALSMLSNVVSLVLTFTVTLRLYFAPFFIVDQGMGGWDAVKASWAATGEQKLMTFLLMLLAAIIGMLGLFALLIGMIFTIPLSYMIYASCYRQMVGGPQPSADAYAPPPTY